MWASYCANKKKRLGYGCLDFNNARTWTFNYLTMENNIFNSNQELYLFGMENHGITISVGLSINILI
jgi:hypothetical protein